MRYIKLFESFINPIKPNNTVVYTPGRNGEKYIFKVKHVFGNYYVPFGTIDKYFNANDSKVVDIEPTHYDVHYDEKWEKVPSDVLYGIDRRLNYDLEYEIGEHVLTDKGDGVIMTIRDNNIYNVYIEGANPPIVVVKGNEIIKSEFHDEYL